MPRQVPNKGKPTRIRVFKIYTAERDVTVTRNNISCGVHPLLTHSLLVLDKKKRSSNRTRSTMRKPLENLYIVRCQLLNLSFFGCQAFEYMRRLRTCAERYSLLRGGLVPHRNAGLPHSRPLDLSRRQLRVLESL